MISAKALGAALESPDGQAVDVTKVEFEVLENGTGRWILWDGERRLHTAALSQRQDLVSAMQVTAVVLRAMMISLQPDPGSN